MNVNHIINPDDGMKLPLLFPFQQMPGQGWA